jgi:3-dehydroquinate synthase
MSKTYNIIQLEEKFSNIETNIKSYNYVSIFVLVDENTKEKCLPLLPYLANQIIIEIPSGEENKTIETCTYIWNQLLQKNADRNSVLINLGGGVISDMGGFCASTFKRGIDFINIPTTLLAQVDATIGGKTGIDFNGLKNMIGVFSHPKSILLNTQFLQTLPQRQTKSGFAEMLKHGLISNENYFNKLRQFDFSKPEKITDLIKESIAIKQKIVDSDPFEKNERKTLNFGHTIGHAIESVMLHTNHQLLHGEAIALGMVGALFLSHKKLNFPIHLVEEISNYLKHLYGFSINLNDFKIQINEAILNDKKNNQAKLNFVLLKQIGLPQINCEISFEELDETIDFINNF